MVIGSARWYESNAERRALLMQTRIWTPEQGHSGLIIIPKPKPILVVRSGQILTHEIPSYHSQTRPSRILDVTANGILIFKRTVSKPNRIIGHPELASGNQVRVNGTLYVSITEAIYLQGTGTTVDIHFLPTQEDTTALDSVKRKVRSAWDNDSLSDGWTGHSFGSKPHTTLQPPSLDTEEPDWNRRLQQLRDLEEA